MEKIFSKIDPKILLHIIHGKKDFLGPMYGLSSEDQYLQALCFMFPKDKEVFAHKHLEIDRVGGITQEAIIVVEGLLEATYYDLDGSQIKKIILKENDCTVTFRGGHSFKSLTENTKFYEIKNGPYQGNEKDKINI